MSAVDGVSVHALDGENGGDRAVESPLTAVGLLLALRPRSAAAVGLSAAGTTVLLGGAVMLGWVMGSSWLVQVHPALVPMQFNTALCFYLCGAGLGAWLLARRDLAGTLGAVTAAIGLLTLFEYGAGVDLGIDEFLMEHEIQVKTSHPGRMAPTTALCFLLSGLALALPRAPRLKSHASSLTAVLGSLTAAIGLGTLVGYGVGVEAPFGWQNATLMALHTAVGFAVLGAGLVGLAVVAGEDRSWVPAAVALVAVVISWSLWRLASVREEVGIGHLVETRMAELPLELSNAVTPASLAMNRMAQRLGAGMHRPEWTQDAAHYLKEIAALKALVWTHRDGTPLAEAGSLDEAVRHSVLVPDSTRKMSVIDAGSPMAVLRFPIPDRSEAGGSVIAVLDSAKLLEPVFGGGNRRWFSARVRLGDLTLFETPVEKLAPGAPASESRVPILDGYWSVSIWPSQALLDRSRTWMPPIVLVVGLIMSGLLGMTARLLMLGRVREAHLAENVHRRMRAERRYRDLSERLEENVVARTRELAESGEFVRLLLESTAEAIYGIDTDGLCTFANPSCARMLGYADPADLLGRNMHELIHHRRSDGSDYPESECRIYRAIQRGHGAHVTDEVLWRNDGAALPVEYWSYPICKDDEVVGAVVTFIDISDRLAWEREVQDLNATLEQRVRERTAQLEASNKELEAFSYSVSHDLRAPLRHITGFAKLLEVSADDLFSDQHRHYLDTISSACDRMGVLIDDLLAYSRSTRRELVDQIIDLNQTLAQVHQDLGPDFDNRSIRWSFEPLPTVRGDSRLFYQVLLNLLQNAVKYTGREERAEISVRCVAGDQDLTVQVKDNGVGFDMQYADKLFGVFQRLHRDDEFQGTGIGLATVRRMVSRYGGLCWAEAAPDEGACFSFTIPASRIETHMTGEAERWKPT